DPNLTTPDGTPILTAAALGGAPSTVEALLSGGAQPTRPDRRGASTLLAAVRAGRLDVAATLLSHGVGANGRADDPETPLLAAARLNRTEAIRLLLAARAPLEVRDRYGASALILVAQR